MEAPGFDAFFVKPYQPDDIVRWIKRRRPATCDPLEEQLSWSSDEALVILQKQDIHAAEAAAELCEDNPLPKKPYDPQIVVDRIKQLLAARKREGDG